jgi:hypothetical protein
MKPYLICALAAIALAVNAEAVPKDKEKDKPDKPREVKVPKDKDKDIPPPVIIIPELPKGKDKGDGPVYSVPDTGSTALLLGTAILALGVVRRRFAAR